MKTPVSKLLLGGLEPDNAAVFRTVVAGRDDRIVQTPLQQMQDQGKARSRKIAQHAYKRLRRRSAVCNEEEQQIDQSCGSK